MFNALVALVLAAQPAVRLSEPSPVVECTASRLRPFVSPFGIRQAWPVAPALPEEFAGQLGHPLVDQGNVDDGYSHWLLASIAGRAAYVVERGGYAGTQKVYGPLPVSVCKLAP